MKKIILLLLITLMGFNACSKFLEEENKSNIASDDVYKTITGFESLVNANYAQLREIYGGDPWMFCSGTDMYADGRPGAATEPIAFGRYEQLNPSTNGVSDLYTNCYKAIQLANMVIYYSTLVAPAATTTAQTTQLATIKERVAEAKYLRANAYFLLVQSYGGVPLILDYFNKEPFVSNPVFVFDRATEKDVYTQILKDLNEALPVFPTYTTGTLFVNRVTRRAIKHLTAKVYLTKGYINEVAEATDFTNAAANADSAALQGTPTFSTISLADLWRYQNAGSATNFTTANNSEVIFSVQYSSGLAPTLGGNKQSYFFSAYTGGLGNILTAPWKVYTLCPTKYAIDLFSSSDKRWAAYFMTTVYFPYTAYYTANATGLDTLPVAHYYAPPWASTDADITNWKNATTITNATNKAAAIRNRANATIHKYPDYALQSYQSSDFATIVTKKFERNLAASQNKDNTRDIILARLGETYLIAAEAYFKSGNTALALTRINAVRTRAGLANLTAIDIDAILDERGRELFGEYHRWYDLKRTGKLIERAVKYNPFITAESQFNGVADKKILRPIPQTVIDLNRSTNFKQNPAY